MLKHRLLAALVMVPLVIAGLFLLPLTLFIGVVLCLCIGAAWEWGQFIYPSVMIRICYAAILGVVLAVFCCMPNSIISLFLHYSLYFSLFWWLIALGFVISYPHSAKYWQSSKTLKSIFGWFTIIPFFCGMVLIRSYAYIESSYDGAIVLLYILVLVWGMDSGAYAAGRLWGKRKLLPLVSPGKTVEGLIGGLITAVIIAIIFNFVLPKGLSFGTLFIGSIVAVLSSVLGDLTESMFKRQAKIKDSGQLIPGHGGILDRIDSLTAAVPIFACLIFILLK